MKAGDLVTVSAYGSRLAYVGSCLRRRQKSHSGEPRPIIGLVIKVTPPAEHRPWEKQSKYKISWIGEADPMIGREAYVKHFNRKDLKMVSKS